MSDKTTDSKQGDDTAFRDGSYARWIKGYLEKDESKLFFTSADNSEEQTDEDKSNISKLVEYFDWLANQVEDKGKFLLSITVDRKTYTLWDDFSKKDRLIKVIKTPDCDDGIVIVY